LNAFDLVAPLLIRISGMSRAIARALPIPISSRRPPSPLQPEKEQNEYSQAQASQQKLFRLFCRCTARIRRDRRAVEIWERSGLLVAQFGMRQRFSRDHPFPHRGVVYEDRFDNGHLP
jgi:hypothetical protein